MEKSKQTHCGPKAALLTSERRRISFIRSVVRYKGK